MNLYLVHWVIVPSGGGEEGENEDDEDEGGRWRPEGGTRAAHVDCAPKVVPFLLHFKGPSIAVDKLTVVLRQQEALYEKAELYGEYYSTTVLGARVRHYSYWRSISLPHVWPS